MSSIFRLLALTLLFQGSETFTIVVQDDDESDSELIDWYVYEHSQAVADEGIDSIFIRRVHVNGKRSSNPTRYVLVAGFVRSLEKH